MAKLLSNGFFLGWQAYLDEREIRGKEERRIGKRGFHDGRRRCRVV